VVLKRLLAVLHNHLLLGPSTGADRAVGRSTLTGPAVAKHAVFKCRTAVLLVRNLSVLVEVDALEHLVDPRLESRLVAFGNVVAVEMAQFDGLEKVVGV